AARDRGILAPAAAARVGTAVDRATGFLRSSQTRNGSWWGRWRPGYLSVQAFVMPALRAGGQDMRAGWLQRARAFVLSNQNADGGWGETATVDRKPELAGNGSSTPLHTASAMIALIAGAPEDDVRGSAPLRKAAAYLAEHESA